MILGRRQRPETAHRKVGVRSKSQDRRHERADGAPARHGSAGRTAVTPGQDDRTSPRPSPCPPRPSTPLAKRSWRRSHQAGTRVSVGGGDPHRSRIQVTRRLEHLAHPGPPGRADTAGAHLHDSRTMPTGQRRGPVGVRRHNQVHGNTDLPGRQPDSGEAGRQQILLVVRGNPTALITPGLRPAPPRPDRHRPGDRPGRGSQVRRHRPAWRTRRGRQAPRARRHRADIPRPRAASAPPAGCRRERRKHEIEHVVQVRTGEVVQELREHDQVESARRPVTGNGPLLDHDVRKAGSVLGRDRGPRHVTRQQPVTPRG